MNDTSIAVLPFTNISDEKDSGFFADGVQADILTNLALVRAARCFPNVRGAGSRLEKIKAGDRVGARGDLPARRVRATGPRHPRFEALLNDPKNNQPLF
ncbi:MAG: hypothetical protein HY736_19230 [Verrucomicrobia bacterium]|nr:hypothetical protein [Verrucomicrobiota bacterium]